MDMSDYTPTTAEIRGMVTAALSEFVSEEESLARFDRWLAKHEADLRASIVAKIEAHRIDSQDYADTLTRELIDTFNLGLVAAAYVTGTTRQDQDHDH